MGNELVIGDLRFSISRRIIGPRNDRSRVVRNSSAIDEIAVLWRSALRIRNAAGLLYFARRRSNSRAGFAQENFRGKRCLVSNLRLRRLPIRGLRGVLTNSGCGRGGSPGLLREPCSLYAKYEQPVN